MTHDIVQAGIAHAGVMEALHRDSFEARWSKQSFLDLLAQSNVNGWIAGSTAPMGFVLIRTAADEAEVLTLAVGMPYRRQGVAQSLILRVFKWLKESDVEFWHLEVADDNDAAIALYQSLGFSESGRRAKYYLSPNGHADAILMTKQVSNFSSISDQTR